MKEKIYLYATLSLFLTNAITLYLFYDYILEEKGTYKMLGLFFNFGYIILFALFLGITLVLFRIISCYMVKKNYFNINFLYVFTAIFCLNTLLNCIFCLALNLLPLKIEIIVISFVLFTISVFIFVDIYKNNFKKNIL